MLIMVFMDRANLNYLRGYVVLGDLVIMGASSLNLLFIVVLVFKLFISLKAAISHPQGYKNKNKFSRAWVQILVPIVQQGEFGFEEIQTNPKTTIPAEHEGTK
jgi:hypothetical protein